MSRVEDKFRFHFTEYLKYISSQFHSLRISFTVSNGFSNFVKFVSCILLNTVITLETEPV